MARKPKCGTVDRDGKPQGVTAVGRCPRYGEYHICGYSAPAHERHICPCGHWWYSTK